MSKKILLGITGSIAASKSENLHSLLSDNNETGQTTGEIYISNWERNNAPCLISLYCIANAESHIPIPDDVKIINNVK